MKNIDHNIASFFQEQGFVIISTMDKDGFVHNSCKGIIEIQDSGRVYLMDVYRGRTLENLARDPRVSITAVDEHKFRGYCLKGRAKALPKDSLNDEIIRAWEDKITSRLTRRLLKNIHEEKGRGHHPEILLPKPEYMIQVEVEEIVDLSPHAIGSL